uniref:Uncharacterized protein n=1 Tax=Candidatus Kentrum sp. FW TaxID=2126338 RepID=A0A450T6A1_9GAMM|nr:MAG: hypothetical protein BECKFW1821A_GA0114235_11218 [Candidatus Kentron sp. FW]
MNRQKYNPLAKLLTLLVSTVIAAAAWSDSAFDNRWIGQYETTTEHWSQFYSPLELRSDGTVWLKGQQIQVHWDPAKNVMSWDSQKVEGNVTSAKVTFSVKDDSPSFSGVIRPRNQDGNVRFQGTMTPIFDDRWIGQYEATTEHWSQFYSPLELRNDGTVWLKGQQIQVHWDPAKNVMSWDSQKVEGNVTSAKVTFSIENNSPSFSGVIRPRNQDGNVSFKGTSVRQ